MSINAIYTYIYIYINRLLGNSFLYTYFFRNKNDDRVYLNISQEGKDDVDDLRFVTLTPFLGFVETLPSSLFSSSFSLFLFFLLFSLPLLPPLLSFSPNNSWSSPYHWFFLIDFLPCFVLMSKHTLFLVCFASTPFR